MQMPPMPQSLAGSGAGANPHGGGESPVCPCCGQPMPMPFNNTNNPQVPLDPRMMGLTGAQGAGGNPYDQSLMSAILGGGDGGGTS
jgi:hypothetical protein